MISFYHRLIAGYIESERSFRGIVVNILCTIDDTVSFFPRVGELGFFTLAADPSPLSPTGITNHLSLECS